MYKRKEIKKTGRERFPKIDLEVHYARRSPCGREKRTEKERERSLLNQVSMYTRGDRRVYVFFFLDPETVIRLLQSINISLQLVAYRVYFSLTIILFPFLAIPRDKNLVDQ